MTSIINSFLVLIILTGFMSTVETKEKKFEIVIITGQNNHNWQATSKTVKKIFESSKLFSATIIRTPEKGEDLSNFKPDLSKYDLICLDYNGDSWPEETKNNFIDFVKDGGGLVLFHASDNAFPEWKEFNNMIGVGGWGNRNESHGPILYLEENEIKQDSTTGRGGSHGKQDEFIIYNRELDHPILKGLPPSWLHTKDELYHSLRGPAKNLTILATAEQEKENGGSGRQEPVLMTINYGKGRVFHSTLGHVGKNSDNLDAILCEGFVTTLLRGSEWAATGKVTQKINNNFPSESATKLIEKHKTLEINTK